MTLTLQKACSVVAATVAISTGMLAASSSAHAFLITRTNGLTAVNPTLAPPTVIDFNFSGPPTAVPTAATSIGPGVTNDGLNGGATIQKTDGVATFQGNQLDVGSNNNVTGAVSFAFDDPRGMGYLGLDWQNPAANETISFLSGTSLIQSFTGADVLAQALGNGGRYFNFFVTNNSEIFNRIVLTRTASNGNAFRVDNLAYQAIPTPALLPGMLAVGLGIFRKRKATANAEVDA